MGFILGVLGVLLFIWKIVIIIQMILHPKFWVGLLYNFIGWSIFIYVLNRYDDIHLGEGLLWAIGLSGVFFFFKSKTVRRPYIVAFSIATLGLGAWMLADSYFADDVEMVAADAAYVENPGIHHVEDHEVSGYVRDDGTPVSGYHRGGTEGYLRTNPDGILENNLKK